MAVVLSHRTALRYLRTRGSAGEGSPGLPCPGFEPAEGERERTSARQGFVVARRPTPAQTAALVQSPLLRGEGGSLSNRGADDPIDVLVSQREQRGIRDGLNVHLWSGPLLTGDDVVRIQEGLYVCSPGLCFLQHAAWLDVFGLTLLGCELTGAYALQAASSYGVAARPALTSVNAMEGLLGRSAGVAGIRLAREALGYVLPNAASPMEARLGLMLSMPRRLGGYGLPPPRLNLRFDVEGEARRVSDKRFYRGDLCWEEARVALEYDSDAAHTGSERIAADTKRRNALVYMGVTVLGVTRRQAFDFGELDKVACILAKLLGVTLRERRSDQAERRRRLHGRLLGTMRWG